ncbi:MAG: PaaI family thioesterase [Terriglobales bacterium]
MARKAPAAGHGNKSNPVKKNLCFACGKDNSHGMHLKFSLDRERNHFVSHFRLSKRYTGPPGHCHGGIIATILDDAMSKLSKLRDVIAATSRMTVEYRRPVPLNKRLKVESREISKRGRRLTRVAEIVDEKGTVLARSRGVFVIIDPIRVFKNRA